MDTSYLVETDLTVKHDGRILCDLYRVRMLTLVVVVVEVNIHLSLTVLPLA